MLNSFLLTLFAFLAFGLTRFGYNVVVYRWPGAAFLGEVNQTYSAFVLVPLFYAPGLGLIASKFASEFRGANESRKASQVFTFSFVVVVMISICATAVMWVAFPSAKGRMTIPRSTVAALAPVLGFYSIHLYFRTAYYGFERVRQYFRNEVVSGVAFFGVLVAALAMRSERLAPWPFAVHSGLFSLIAVYDLRDRYDFRNLFTGIHKDLLRYSRFFGATIVNSVAGPGAVYMGILLTGYLTANKPLVGSFGLLIQTLLPLSMLATAIAVVLVPPVSQRYGAGRTQEGVAISGEAFRPLFMILVLIWGLGLTLGWEIVGAITNRADVPPAFVIAFEIILLGVVSYLVAMPPTVLLNATRHIEIVAAGGIVAIGLALITWRLAIPEWKLIGAAAGYGVLQCAKSLWVIGAARRLYKWRAQLGWRGAAVAIAALGAGMVSLANGGRAVHVAAAAIFVLFFFVLYARAIRDYIRLLNAGRYVHRSTR